MRVKTQREAAGRGKALAGRTCKRCGEPVPASRDSRAIYCSDRCNRAEQHEREAELARKLREITGPRICEFCGQEFTGRQWSARHCSDGCKQAASNARRGAAVPEPRPHTHRERLRDLENTIRAYPGPPALPGAACAGHPALHADAWTSPVPAQRSAAMAVCLTGCPALAACQTWALSLPDGFQGIVGGMGQAGRRRVRLRRQREAGAA